MGTDNIAFKLGNDPWFVGLIGRSLARIKLGLQHDKSLPCVAKAERGHSPRIPCLKIVEGIHAAACFQESSCCWVYTPVQVGLWSSQKHGRTLSVARQPCHWQICHCLSANRGHLGLANPRKTAFNPPVASPSLPGTRSTYYSTLRELLFANQRA